MASNINVGWLTNSIQTTQYSRLLTQYGMWPGSAINSVRSGVVPSPGAAALSTVSAMVAAVAPFTGLIQGTLAADQGAYPVCNRAPVNITFANGEAGITRNDRIICRVKDDSADSGGLYEGNVEYLKGNTSTGAVTALPANAIALWKIPVLAGASAGGGGINFGTAVKEWQPIVALGGILSVTSDTERDALTGLITGATVANLSSQRLEFYNGSNFVPSSNRRWTKSKLPSPLTYNTGGAWVGFTSDAWQSISLPGVKVGDQIEIRLNIGVVASATTDNIGVSFAIAGVGITESDYSHELLHIPDNAKGYGFTYSYSETLTYPATTAGTAVISPRTRTQGAVNGTLNRGLLDARIIR